MDAQKMSLLGRLAASFRTSVSTHIRQGGMKRQSYFKFRVFSSHIRDVSLHLLEQMKSRTLELDRLALCSELECINY